MPSDAAMKIGNYFAVQAPASAVFNALQKSRFFPECEHLGAPRCDQKRDLMRAGGFVLNLARRDSSASELSMHGNSVPVVPFPQATMCLVNLVLDSSANDECPDEHVVFYVRRSSFNRLTDALGAARIRKFPLAAGVAADDPMMAHLGACLLPAIEQPDQVNDLVVDQIAAAVHTHLAQRLGAMQQPLKLPKGGLAPWQLSLAQKALIDRSASNTVVAQVASDFRLSRSHFIRAFTRSCGMPPHRWLIRCRVKRAADLLQLSTLTLSEIALICGFFDQSHLSRAFSQFYGLAPGQWRRLNQTLAKAPRKTAAEITSIEKQLPRT